MHVFNIIKGINESKTLKNIYRVTLNVNSIVESVIQIKYGITINVDVSVKNIYVKKIIFEILLHVAMRMVNIYQVFLMIQ